MVAGAYSTASAKLSAKHYESHYAYNQQQQRETFYNQTLQTFDQWGVDKGLSSSPEELAGLGEGIRRFFGGQTKPEGMTDMAWHGVVQEALTTSLRNGNIGAYNAARAHGWMDNLSAKDRVAMDEAIGAYDTDFSQKAQLVVENTHIAALEVASMDEAAGLYQKGVLELASLESRLSGTERADLALAKAKKALMKGWRTAFDTGKKNARKGAQLEALKLALREEDPRVRSGMITQLQNQSSVSSKHLEKAMDATIVEDITRLTGTSEMLTESEAVKILMENPEVAKTVATRLRGKQVNSPMVKRVAETFFEWLPVITERRRATERERRTSDAGT